MIADERGSVRSDVPLSYIGEFRDESEIAEFERTPFESRFSARSVHAALAATARRHPDKIAIRFLPNGLSTDAPQTMTFLELFRQTTSLANLFRSLAGGANGPIAIVLPNVPEFHAIVWAAATAGIAFPINCYLEAESIASLVKAAGARVVVSPGEDRDPEIWRRAIQAADILGKDVSHLVLSDDASVSGNLDVLSRAHSGAELDFAPDEDFERIAAYVHTGGTTGTPKIAMQSVRSLLFEAWIMGAIRQNQQESCTVCGGPLFHVAGLVVTSLVPMVWGNSVLMLSPLGYRAPGVVADLWNTVRRFGVTQLTLVPTVLSVLVDLPFPSRPETLKAIGSGASVLPDTLARRFTDKTGLPIRQGYGMTEAGCGVTTSLHSPVPAGSIGRRLPYIQIRIARLDREGHYLEEAPRGESGVLLVRGPNVFSGYLGNAESPWIGDGWLNTGDLGYCDAAGSFWLTGRAKDSINRSGHNIDPGMIEEALLSIPGVRDAAAVAMPDAYAGELPIAYVACADGSDAQAILDRASELIPERAAIPKRIVMLDELPKTTVGKIDKVTLRLRAAELAVTERLFDAGLSRPDFEISRTVEKGAARLRVVLASGVGARHKAAAADAVGALGIGVDLVADAIDTSP